VSERPQAETWHRFRTRWGRAGRSRSACCSLPTNATSPSVDCLVESIDRASERTYADRAILGDLEERVVRERIAGAIGIAGAALVDGRALLVDGLVVVARLVRNADLGGVGPHGQIVAALARAGIGTIDHVLGREIRRGPSAT